MRRRCAGVLLWSTTCSRVVVVAVGLIPVCVCCVRVRACVRACVRVCACVCVRVLACMCVGMHFRYHPRKHSSQA